MLKKLILIWLIFSCSGLHLFAQHTSNEKASSKWQILPSCYFTPQTSLGLGAIVLHYIVPDDSLTNQSNSQYFINGTLNKQFRFQGDYNFFTKRNNFYFKGNHEVSIFPEWYFGLGNNTEKEDACLIDYRLFDFEVLSYKKIKGNAYIGVGIHHQSVLNLMSVHNSTQKFMHSDYSASGFSLEFLLDKRDYILNPHNGMYLEYGITGFKNHKTLNNNFSRAFFDLRLYKTFGKLVTNWAWFQEHNFGDVPFNLMPKLGGAHFLRGFYYGRFRANNLHVIQAECRRKMIGKFGMALFGGFGQVFHNQQEFGVQNYHFSYGAGLRYEIHEDSKANVRLDFGKTADSHGVYIVYAEAF